MQFSLGATIALVFIASASSASEIEIDATQRFFSASIPEALQLSAVRSAVSAEVAGASVPSISYQLSLQLAILGRPIDVLGLRLGLDTGLLDVSKDGLRIDFREGTKAWGETGALGETWAELQLGAQGTVLLRAGKLRPRLGGGAVFDAYAFGVYADVDLRLAPAGPPWFFRAHAVLPDGTFTARAKTSPLFSVQVGYEPRRGLELRLLGMLFVDQADLTAPIFADAYSRGVLEAARTFLAERPRLDVQVQRCGPAGGLPLSDCLTSLYNLGLLGFELESRGLLGWSGLEVEWNVGTRARFRGLGLMGLGHIVVQTAPDGGFAALLRDAGANVLPEGGTLAQQLSPDGALSVLAGFGLIEAEVWPLEELAIEAFVLAETGDSGLQGASDTYNGFLSLAPLLPYTSLFFGGAVLTNLATPVVVSASPDGAGLFGAGLGLAWWPADRLRLAGTAAVLNALSRSELSPNRYMGLELDARVSLWLLDALLSVEADAAIFLPGPFFGPETPTAYQAILSTSLRFP
jgi:hypothetical protein